MIATASDTSLRSGPQRQCRRCAVFGVQAQPRPTRGCLCGRQRTRAHRCPGWGARPGGGWSCCVVSTVFFHDLHDVTAAHVKRAGNGPLGKPFQQQILGCLRAQFPFGVLAVTHTVEVTIFTVERLLLGWCPPMLAQVRRAAAVAGDGDHQEALCLHSESSTTIIPQLSVRRRSLPARAGLMGQRPRC